jgi:hypothetical protein
MSLDDQHAVSPVGKRQLAVARARWIERISPGRGSARRLLDGSSAPTHELRAGALVTLAHARYIERLQHRMAVV